MAKRSEYAQAETALSEPQPIPDPRCECGNPGVEQVEPGIWICAELVAEQRREREEVCYCSPPGRARLLTQQSQPYAWTR